MVGLSCNRVGFSRCDESPQLKHPFASPRRRSRTEPRVPLPIWGDARGCFHWGDGLPCFSVGDGLSASGTPSLARVGTFPKAFKR